MQQDPGAQDRNGEHRPKTGRHQADRRQSQRQGRQDNVTRHWRRCEQLPGAGKYHQPGRNIEGAKMEKTIKPGIGGKVCMPDKKYGQSPATKAGQRKTYQHRGVKPGIAPAVIIGPTMLHK
ncbi:MAG: hypothetical protein B7Z75_00155 [Acidocella sp. 20-57-95]|nr:MAG: hypothetical protein B7Z75_00155 [Acidocella sp. 20-57-95]